MSKRAAAPIEHPGAGRKHVQLQLGPEHVQGLRLIMAMMLEDPAQGQTRIGLQSAVIYAIEHTVRNPPRLTGGKRG